MYDIAVVLATVTFQMRHRPSRQGTSVIPSGCIPSGSLVAGILLLLFFIIIYYYIIVTIKIIVVILVQDWLTVLAYRRVVSSQIYAQPLRGFNLSILLSFLYF